MKSQNAPAISLQKTMAVLAAHKIALWEYDCDSGKVHFAEDYFQILGFDKVGVYFESAEEAFEFIHPDDREIFNPRVFAERMRIHHQLPPLCFRLVGCDNKPIWIEETFFSVADERVAPPQNKPASFPVRVCCWELSR